MVCGCERGLVSGLRQYDVVVVVGMKMDVRVGVRVEGGMRVGMKMV